MFIMHMIVMFIVTVPVYKCLNDKGNYYER